MTDSSAAGVAAVRVGTLGIVGWVLFEWAAQPFYSLITTFLFAPYFANVFIPGDPAWGQALWGYTAGAMGICVALLSPVIGAMVDASGWRKPWIAIASVLMIAGMATLWYALPGRSDLILLVVAAYVVAGIAAEINGTLVNSIMPRLVPASQFGRLSGIAVAVAYLGGLLALILVAGFITAAPDSGRTLLGLEPVLQLDAGTREGDRFVGPFCAVWFLVFSLPFFLFTPDPRPSLSSRSPVADGLAALRETARDIANYGNVVWFLLARMLYQDGLGGIFAFAGIYGGTLFGWQAFETGILGIILIVAAMSGAAVGGLVEDKLGPKAVIMVSLLLAILGTVGVLSIDATHVLFTTEVVAKAPGSGIFASHGEQVFLLSAVIVGLVAGPLNSSSRSLMARISPPDKLAQFFGFYAFSGKATSFIAPIMIGLMTSLTGDQRLGVAVVIGFLVLGLLMIPLVRVRSADQ
jgi:UMF1 family MFS transporter